MKVGLIFGTRPEAIKFAPLYLELKKRGIDYKVIITGQHKEMLNSVLDLFQIDIDYNLEIMREGQSLATLTSRLIDGLDKIIKKESFDWIFVQGDTTSAFCGALSAFYNQVKIAHIEAGLRTCNLLSPFPEEANRKLIGTLANLHFAPTTDTRENLAKEGIKGSVYVVGNTVIDALFWVKENKEEELKKIRKNLDITGDYILVTMHRRENIGINMINVLRGIKEFSRDKNYKIVIPMHLNPKVRDIIKEEMEGFDNAILLEPQDYLGFLALLDGCRYVMTDSGGVQEEAPSLGKPTLVLRDTTERPEAIRAGTAKLIGTDRSQVIKYMKLLEGELYEEMNSKKNPYGNGDTSKLIVDKLMELKL